MVSVFLCCFARAGDPNLVAHWTFDEGSGTTAYDSTGVNHGTLAGNTAWTTGQIGGALEFDGSGDWVDCGNDASINNLSTFSVSAWFKTDVIPESYVYPHIICQRDLSHLIWAFILQGDWDGKVGAAVMTSGADALSNAYFIPEAGTWYHAVMNYDNKGTRKINIYINGDEHSYFQQDAATGTLSSNPSVHIAIGNRIGGGKDWDGAIDDVRIYNKLLSLHEIRMLYNQLELCSSDAALYFDGEDDYVVDMGAGSELNFERTDKFTLSAWYKGSGPHNTLLSKMDKEINRYRGYDVFINGGYVTTHIINHWVSNAIRVDGTLYPVIDSAWHNIAVTYNGSSSASGVKIYVDGMIETTSVYANSLSGSIQTPETFKVGARSLGSGTTQHLEGTIDEVSVWDAALTQEQIQAQMYVPLEGSEANLVAAWNFDEAEGQIAHDLTGGDDAFLGSDPCNIDSADPIWVMPGAPVMCTPIVEVALDIKPGGCPNPLNVKSKGVLPAAILGTEDVDVTMIDPTSIRLAGVEPLRSSIEDVAAPVADANECDCTTAGPDGYADLTLKFESQAIIEAIGEVNDGQIVALPVTGVLTDGTPIEGADCVLVFGRYKPFNQADTNKDGVVDIADFAILADNWLKSSIIQD